MTTPTRRIVMVTGLPASGKTYLAEHLAQHIGAVHLNTDIIRGELGLLGQYDEEHKQQVYNALFAALQEKVKEHDVIVDATFSKKAHRDRCLKIAEASNALLRMIETRAGESTIQGRMQQQRKYSEANYAVYQKMKSRFDHLEMTRLVVYTDIMSFEESLDYILPYLKYND